MSGPYDLFPPAAILSSLFGRLNISQTERHRQLLQQAALDDRLHKCLAQLYGPTAEYDARTRSYSVTELGLIAQNSDADRLHQLMRQTSVDRSYLYFNDLPRASIKARPPTEREIAIKELREFLGEVLWELAPI